MLEVLQDADSLSEMLSGAWGSQSGYYLMRTQPADQMLQDYGYDAFGYYPTMPLIDLTTMEVLHVDCQSEWSWESCIDGFL